MEKMPPREGPQIIAGPIERGKRTIKQEINLILSGCSQRAHPSFKLPKERLIKVILSSKNDGGCEMGLAWYSFLHN